MQLVMLEIWIKIAQKTMALNFNEREDKMQTRENEYPCGITNSSPVAHKIQ